MIFIAKYPYDSDTSPELFNIFEYIILLQWHWIQQRCFAPNELCNTELWTEHTCTVRHSVELGTIWRDEDPAVYYFSGKKNWVSQLLCVRGHNGDNDCTLWPCFFCQWLFLMRWILLQGSQDISVVATLTHRSSLYQITS